MKQHEWSTELLKTGAITKELAAIRLIIEIEAASEELALKTRDLNAMWTKLNELLYPADPEMRPDPFVYDEICGLHDRIARLKAW